METSVKYRGDGQSAIWHIPFAFAREADVRCRLIEADGQERELAYGADYAISGQKLIRPLAATQTLQIWLNGCPETAQALSAQALAAGPAFGQERAAAPACSPASFSCDSNVCDPCAQTAQPAAGPIAYAGDPTVEAAANELAARADALVSQTSDRLADAGDLAVSKASERMRQTLAAAVNETGLYGMATAKSAGLAASQSLPAGSVITLPDGLAYFPGRGQLQVYKNGKILRLETDFLEAGGERPASHIRLVNSLAAGDSLDFWVLPITSAAAAEAAAREAEGSANNAAASLRLARETAQAIAAAGDSSATCADAAEAYSKEAERQALLAHKEAQAAWRSAVSATVHNSRPGIAALKSLDEQTCMATGFFVINPHITHSPTPFMGIWPVESIAQMAWDGVFIIGPKYPECPKMPPHCPPPYDPQWPKPDTAGDAGDWLPDGHRHDRYCLCGKNEDCAGKKPF